MTERWPALRTRERRSVSAHLDGMAGLYFGGWVVVPPELFLPFLPCRLCLRILVAFLPDSTLCLWWLLPFLPVPVCLSVLPPVACPEAVPARASKALIAAATSGFFLLFIFIGSS
jgi:hypothetical protein